MKADTSKQTFLFRNCSLLDLEKQFSLEQVYHSGLLSPWKKASEQTTITAVEKEMIAQWQELLLQHVHDWNEHELSMYFISPIISLISFHTNQFNLFSQRTLSANIQDTLLTGKPDGLIAKGKRAPELPFFCLHEFKKEREGNNDPAGQLLAAMLVAQHQNKTILGDQNMPIYGCYVVGRFWYFVVLVGTTYTISRDYSAVRTDIYDIVKLLKGLKVLLLEQVNALDV